MSMLKETLEQVWGCEGLVKVINMAQADTGLSESETKTSVILSTLAAEIGAYVLRSLDDLAWMLPEDVLGMIDEAESMIEELGKDKEDD